MKSINYQVEEHLRPKPAHYVSVTPCPQGRMNHVLSPVMVGSNGCINCDNYAGTRKQVVKCRDK
jgi:hypothetical protein